MQAADMVAKYWKIFGFVFVGLWVCYLYLKMKIDTHSKGDRKPPTSIPDRDIMNRRKQ